jgi:hypothetical protein
MEIRISQEELSKKKLFVATPMYGGACMGVFAKSIADLSAICTRYGVSLQLYLLFNESLIPRARNYCCDEFLRSDANHFLFLDGDIGFDPNDIIQMLALQTDDSPYDILGAPYPKKCISWEKIVMAVNKGLADNDPSVLDKYVGDFVFNPKPGITSFQISEPVEVLELGTGFMMIKRATMQKFADSFPQYLYRPDHVRTKHFDGSRKITMFFQSEIDQYSAENVYENLIEQLKALSPDDPETINKLPELITLAKKVREETEEKKSKKSLRYLSEDYWFCQRCQDIGIKSFLLPWMKTMHVGSMVYGGSLADLAQIGANPTADPTQLRNKQ